MADRAKAGRSALLDALTVATAPPRCLFRGGWQAARNRPARPAQALGREAIVERFRIWTEDISDYELAESDAAPFADLLRLRWAVRGVDPEVGLNVYEQTAYAEVVDGEIVRMRLACSGHRPL